MSTNNNSNVILDTCTQRLNALNAHAPNNSKSIVLDGGHRKVSEVKAVYQASLSTRALLKQKRTELKAAVTAWRKAEKNRRATDKVLRPWVETTFGADSQTAHEFGFLPRKVGKPTVTTLYGAQVQAKATRTAHHTEGNKERSMVDGLLPADPSGSPANAAAPKA
jgi:hypothetical protein